MLLTSEYLKTKRTAMRWLVFLVPVILPSLVAGYVWTRGMGSSDSMFIFQLFFETWTVLVLPIGIGVLTASMIYLEEGAGSFVGLLSSKKPKYQLYLSKLAILILMLTVSTGIALIVYGLVLYPTIHMMIEPFIYISAAILVIVSAIPLFTLHLWISLAWGTGATIGVSIAGLLIAALVGATSLGSTIWPFVPWAWPVRLAKLPGQYLLYTADMAVPPEVISSGIIWTYLAIGMVAVLIFTLITLFGGMLWFNRWEGRKAEDS